MSLSYLILPGSVQTWIPFGDRGNDAEVGMRFRTRYKLPTGVRYPPCLTFGHNGRRRGRGRECGQPLTHVTILGHSVATRGSGSQPHKNKYGFSPDQGIIFIQVLRPMGESARDSGVGTKQARTPPQLRQAYRPQVCMIIRARVLRQSAILQPTAIVSAFGGASPLIQSPRDSSGMSKIPHAVIPSGDINER